MRPLRGIDTSLWAPLFDGTYAIVMTLLVLELPAIGFDLVNEYNHHEIGIWPLMIDVLKLIIGYLGAFLIIFDVWVKKRRLLSITERYCQFRGFDNIALLLSLFISTLLPPIVSLCWKVEQELRIQALAGNQNISIETVEVTALHLLFGISVLLIYVIINHISIQSCSRLKNKVLTSNLGDLQTEISSKISNLQGVRRDTTSRIIASPLLLLSWLSPHLLIFIYGLIGLWHSDSSKPGGRN